MIGKIKHIVVFESLPNGEKKTGEELYSDCISRRIDFFQNDKMKMSHMFYRIASKVELVELIKYYQVNASYLNNGLLFHFEMHGDSNCAGLVLADNSLITWKELIELFRPINVTTKNNLFITMATCNGRFLLKETSHYEKSPFSGYISASKEISVEEILNYFNVLFEELISTGNIVKAYLELEKEKTNFFYKDSQAVFEDAFNISVQELRNDTEFRNKTIQDTIIKTGKAPTEKEYNAIMLNVENDMYEKCKQAFCFK